MELKIYVAGKITGNDNFVEEFKQAETELKKAGHVVINPSLLPVGFEHDEYMKVCLPMVGICDAIYLLNGWEHSKGANMEKDYAESLGKLVLHDLREPVDFMTAVNSGKRIKPVGHTIDGFLRYNAWDFNLAMINGKWLIE